MIDYGNGVSIDTDQVIYIENGPNFHTYTFKIKRENAPETAPLENLLLSPLPDGTYQEFLVTYNLTAQEREKIRNGEPVNTKGKTTIAELAKGTFNSGGQLAKMSCNWHEETVWQGCSHIVKGQSYHNASNIDDWPNCKADVKPSVYTIVTGGCNTEQPEYIDPGNSGGGNSGGGGPAGNGPDECTTVANNPGEVGIIDENGCHVGGATQPNDPPVKGNPCDRIVAENSKAKEYYNKTKFQGRKAEISIGINVKNGPEKSFSFGDNTDGEQVSNIITGESDNVGVVSKSNQFIVRGGGHTHTPGIDESPPSFADVYTFLDANTDNPEFKYYFTFVYDGSEYVFTITDAYKLNNFKANYPKDENVNPNNNKWLYDKNIGRDAEFVIKYLKKQGENKHEAFELALAFVLKKYNTGIGMSKKDTNGDFKPIFVAESQDPVNPKKRIYQKTDNCNL